MAGPTFALEPVIIVLVHGPRHSKVGQLGDPVRVDQTIPARHVPVAKRKYESFINESLTYKKKDANKCKRSGLTPETITQFRLFCASHEAICRTDKL